MTRLRVLGAVLIAASLFAFARPAQAQYVDGATRVGLEVPIGIYEKATISVNGIAPAGVGDSESSRTSAGPSAGGAVLNIGFGLGDWVLGGKLLLGNTSEDGAGAPGVISFTIMPGLEYLFLSGSALRPFVSAGVGYRTSSSTSSGGTTVAESSFLVGPGAGLHVFMGRNISIDMAASALLTKGSAKVGEVDFDRGGYILGMTFGISSWVGASDPTSVTPSTQSLPDTQPVSPTSVPAQEAPSPLPPSAPPPRRKPVEAPARPISLALELPRQGGTSIRAVLTGEPRPDVATVRVEVSTSLAGKPPAHCDATQIEVNGAVVPLENGKVTIRPAFSSFSVAVDGAVPLSLVEAVGQRASKTL